MHDNCVLETIQTIQLAASKLDPALFELSSARCLIIELPRPHKTSQELTRFQIVSTKVDSILEDREFDLNFAPMKRTRTSTNGKRQHRIFESGTQADRNIFELLRLLRSKLCRVCSDTTVRSSGRAKWFEGEQSERRKLFSQLLKHQSSIVLMAFACSLHQQQPKLRTA